MTSGEILDFLRDALMTALIIAAPILIVSIGVGLVVSIFQAATQINEQTLTFVPKIVAISILLIAAGPWMLSVLTQFTSRIFERIVNLL